MLKKYIALTGVAFLATASIALAGSLDSDKGTKITITQDDTKAPREFTFQPSPQIDVRGNTGSNKFVVSAVHNAAIGKKGGSAYAMSSETSGLYTALADAMEKLDDVALDDATADGIEGYKLEGVASGS